ncbi:hypothetical protein [Latilactobacillus curvatus]|uniref:hypothetical protein n=1 Tax=Latilactobacillus curvatus TaxID=28038 RepID=UPI000B5F88F8|nr:hypothetical protein [Latilactobacillus curvatus]ASN61732.1 hypothetical protein CGZ47_03925 [Latilactobacillus curvatus]AZP96207.1 hypothetical protein CYK59_04245 [Latilactobacillus curvatus]MCT2879855.1 hypothetical protein [Latilactobacillus curvatus]
MVKNVDINLIGTPGYPELVAQLGVVSPMIYDPVKLRSHQQQLVAGAVNILCDVNQLTQSDAQWLLALPQYQTVYLEVPKNLSIQNVLTQIGAADYSQLDLTEIRMALNQDFFIGQRSYRILPQSVIRINERFTGAIDWQGTSSVQLTGTFSADREDKQLLIQFPENPIQVQKYQSGFFYSNQMLFTRVYVSRCTCARSDGRC